MFDWVRFLASRNIEYVTSGPNVGGRDHIAVHCPFCGDADPSQHMSVSLKGLGWRCWRSPQQHRGVRPARLVAAILRCSYEMAAEICGEANVAPLEADEDLSARVAANLGMVNTEVRPSRVVLPKEFKLVRAESVFGRMYWNYLMGRGYNQDEARWLIENYKLHFTMKRDLDQFPGLDFTGRVIIPVYSTRHEVWTWTARAISDSAIPRYKTLPRDLGCRAIGTALLGLPLLWNATGARTLVLCEGPFDAMTVTVLGWRLGVYGTCLFGLNISEEQADLLDQLTWFPRKVLLLDGDAALKTLEIMQWLPRDVRPLALPSAWKDPGKLAETVDGRRFISTLAA